MLNAIRHALYLADPEASDPVGELLLSEDGAKRVDASGRHLLAGVVTVHGQVGALDLAIPGAEIDGAEAWFADGRLAGASEVHVTVSSGRGERLAELTGLPVLAAIDAEHLPSRITEGENLLRIAEAIRKILPHEVVIRIAVPDDTTPATEEAKRQAEIRKERAEEELQGLPLNAQPWKRNEIRQRVELALRDALGASLYDAAAYAAERIGARLYVLGER